MSDILDDEEEIIEEEEEETPDVTPEDPSDETDEDTSNEDDSEDEAPEEPEIEIELIVEDGNCIPDANSYVSLEEAEKYMAQHYRTSWLELSESEKEASLIKATQYVDNLYTWLGRRKFETQPMAFPRVMLRDRDGFIVKGIPRQLKQAVMEAAFYGSTADTLFTVYASGGGTGALKRDKKRVEGAVETEVEYFSNSETTIDYISKYAALDSILAGLYIPKNWHGSVNTKVRWTY